MRLPDIAIKWLLKIVKTRTGKRTADITLKRSDGSFYLLRWYLLPRNRMLNVYLHEFVGDDDDRALHDHPWWSLSFMLRGKLIEVTDDKSIIGWHPGERILYTGDIIFRRANFAHRLLISKPYRNKSPITLFITGPRIREWGFQCPQGWRHWKEFTSTDGSSVGKGCDD